jgi:hypothetical protein
MARKSLLKLLAGSSLLILIAVVTLMPVLRKAFASPVPPTPPSSGSPLHYSTGGKAVMTVNGPGCCDGITFPATFLMDYSTDGSGAVHINRLQSTLADMDLRFHFLIFETAHVEVRCGVVKNSAVIEATQDAFGGLNIPSGSATLAGDAHQTRDAEGNCGGTYRELTLTNNAPLTGVLDPTGNRVLLNGSFATTTEGNAYNITLEMTGEYLNRPPVAVFGVEGPGLEAFAQGGCPAVLNSGNPPEYVVEANDPSGLKMYLKSFSNDPDGAWSGGDIGFDQWYYAKNSEPQKFLGEGRRFGPMSFGFGDFHSLTLQTTDRLGVSTKSDCNFRVVDRTPPVVTPPPDTTVDSTVDGGTTPSTSDALRDFLGKATASDQADSAPKALPPLYNGVEVTGSTFFPITTQNQWIKIKFRFTDKFGNVSGVIGYLRVVGKKK